MLPLFHIMRVFVAYSSSTLTTFLFIVCYLFTDKYLVISFSIKDIDENHLFIHGYCKTIERKILENNSDDDFGWDGKYPPPSANVSSNFTLFLISFPNIASFILLRCLMLYYIHLIARN